MKTATRVLDVTSTLQGEKIGMSIDESAFAHIMSVLTDLYSDPEMAVIREYATNAFDAHVEAGVSRPIEVQLPSPLSPFLRIRDYGDGVDVDDIREIYSRYGTSTKRHTNDLVGTLGLGCKSALTYTNAFTLSGWKDGRCVQVSISRDEDGAGSMVIVGDYETDEESGVEITVPVKSDNDFEAKARYLFQFWPKGSVLVNDEEPAPVDGIWFDGDLVVLPAGKGGLESDIVVMGNVPYPVERERYWETPQYHWVAFVPIGAVQFTPSREALQMTPATQNVIEDIRDRVRTGKQAAIEKLIAESTDRSSALASMLKWTQIFQYKGDLTYQDAEIPDKLDFGDEYAVVVRRFRDTYGRRKRVQDEYHSLPISSVLKAIFLTGYTGRKLTPTGSAKLNQWSAKLSGEVLEDVENYILVDKLPHTDWIESSRIYKWDDVKAEKLERNSGRQDGRLPGSYLVTEGKDGYAKAVPGDDIDDTNGVFYHVRHEYPSKALRIVQDAYPDATYVDFERKGREGKFLRVFPDAKSVEEAAREIALEWQEGLTTRDRLWLQVRNNYYRQGLSKLDRSRIHDVALRIAVRIAKREDTVLAQQANMYHAFVTVNEEQESTLTETYPLLQNLMDAVRYHGHDEQLLDHVYLYVNAANLAAKGVI